MGVGYWVLGAEGWGLMIYPCAGLLAVNYWLLRVNY